MELRILGIPVFSFRSGGGATPRWNAPEQRSRQFTYKDADLFGGYVNTDGVPTVVNDTNLLSVTPVWAAIRYISEAIAALQSGVFKRTGDNMDVIMPYETHPVAELFQSRPHPHYNTFDFTAGLIATACLGDGYARIHRNQTTFRPAAIELLPRDVVTQMMSRTGQVFYRIQGIIGTGEMAQIVDEMIPDTDMIHIKGMTVNGINGEQVRLIHRATMRAGMAETNYTDNFLRSGGMVGGVLTYPGEASPENRLVVETQVIPKMSGSGNAGKIAFLDAGMDFKPTQLAPNQAMLTDFNKMNVAAVSRIFKIPQHKLGEMTNATFSNIEVQSLEWVVDCLTPWVKRIEAEFNSRLFNTTETRTGRVFYRFNLNSLLRGDTEARSKFYATMLQNGVYTPNEVRAMENMNPIEGGDELYIQGAMVPLSSLLKNADAAAAANGAGASDQTNTNTPAKDATPAAAA